MVFVVAAPRTGGMQLTVGCEPLRNVADTRQVQRTWLDVQFFENCVSPRIIVRLIDTAGFVVQVTEDDGPCWASILAG